MLQVNILGKPVKPEALKVPEEIAEKAKAMLEPEERKNVVIVDKRIEDKCPKSDMANNLHNPTICPMCKQDKELVWVNPGGLGANIEICRDCVPKLFEGYGYKEPGYRIIDENTVEIFSETTGWERIKTYWVKKFFENIFANDLFPLCVYLEHPEIRERDKQGGDFNLDHEVYGITWAAARFLSIRANVPIPEDLVQCVRQVNKR